MMCLAAPPCHPEKRITSAAPPILVSPRSETQPCPPVIPNRVRDLTRSTIAEDSSSGLTPLCRNDRVGGAPRCRHDRVEGAPRCRHDRVGGPRRTTRTTAPPHSGANTLFSLSARGMRRSPAPPVIPNRVRDLTRSTIAEDSSSGLTPLCRNDRVGACGPSVGHDRVGGAPRCRMTGLGGPLTAWQGLGCAKEPRALQCHPKAA